MSVVEETIENQDSKRLTFRQRFWLFGVGGPVLLMIVLLALAVFLPKPLNPTEKKLLGRWEIVSSPCKGRIVEFQPHYFWNGAERFKWSAESDTLRVTDLRSGEVTARIFTTLGLHSAVNEIIAVTESQLKLKSRSGSTVVMRRIDLPNEGLQESQ